MKAVVYDGPRTVSVKEVPDARIVMMSHLGRRGPGSLGADRFASACPQRAPNAGKPPSPGGISWQLLATAEPAENSR
jgi:hypothetical protein